MHYGVYCGRKAEADEEKILILSESHHVNTDDKETDNKTPGVEATYTTQGNIVDYLKDPCADSYRIYDTIVKTFGFEPEKRVSFWNRVFFGNYIDVLCGIGDNYAKEYVGGSKNRVKLNDQLFQFVNEYQIDTIYCFSILSYDKLPSLSTSKEEGNSSKFQIGKTASGKKYVYLRKCYYEEGQLHKWTNIILRKPLTVFGITHPSSKGGYPLETYRQILRGKIRLSE